MLTAEQVLSHAQEFYGSPENPQGGWPEEWANEVRKNGDDWIVTICTECSIGVTTREVRMYECNLRQAIKP